MEKIYIPDFKPDKLYQHFVDVCSNEYKRLCDKHKTNIIAFIDCRETDRLDVFWKSVQIHPDMQKTAVFVPNYISQFVGDIFMSTQLTAFVNTPACRGVMQYMWIGREALTERLFISLNHLDVFEEFCKISMQHEFGHCLYNEHVFAKVNYDQYKAAQFVDMMVKDRLKGVEKLLTDYQGKPRDEEFYKRYHDLPLEKEANEIVGLTYLDHWKCLQVLEDHE